MKIAMLLLIAACLAGCGADDNEPEPCWEPFGPSYCIAPPDCRVPPECRYIIGQTLPLSI